MTHLDYERQSPVWRHWVRELSRGHTLIRYDERGCGLSDRQFDGTPTLDTYVGDLAAVVDAAGLERFALLGLSGGGPTAIEYAARNPERVSRLVLYGTWARGRDRRGDGEAEQSRLLGDLMRVGWGGTDPRIPAGVQLDLHPERRRGAEALVRRPAAGLEQWRDGRTAVAVAQPNRHQRHGAPHHAAGARPTRATRPGRPLRGGAAPRVPPTGRSLRDARERQPHPPGRRAGLGGVSLGGARVLGRRRASTHRGRRSLRPQRARARSARAGGRRDEQRADRGAAVPEHPHSGAPPLERLREAATVRQVRARRAAARFSRT